MKVTAKLDGGYGSPTREQVLASKGFVLTSGDYTAPSTVTIRLTFDEGLALLNELVAAAKQHHDAVSESLAETGRLARFGDALSQAEEVARG